MGNNRAWTPVAAIVVALISLAIRCDVPTREFIPADPLETRIRRIESSLIPSDFPAGAAEPATITERMAYFGVPGVSVAVVRNDEIEWARGYGLADVASGTPVDPDTLFQAASLSKAVAAMVALTFVDEGAVDLDGDLAPILGDSLRRDEGTGTAPVTLRRLLSHAGGVNVSGFPGYRRDEPVPNTLDVIEGEANTEPIRVVTEPGSNFAYSGGGYVLVQLLVEQLTGESFADVAKGRVLAPLGMTRSTFEQPLPDTMAPGAAIAYRPTGEPVAGGARTYPETAAAGLWTTPSDLARFLASLAEGRRTGRHPVLSRELLAEMLIPVLDGYALGLAIDEEALAGHVGANEGYRCRMTIRLDDGFGAVVMTNSDAGRALVDEILGAIED